MRKIKSYKGFTFIELLITIIVISVGLVGIMSMFENVTNGIMQADLNVIATNLAHEKLEQIVLDKWRDGYDALDESNYPDESLSGDFGLFSRSTSIVEVDGTDLVTEAAGSGYKRVEVTVSWGDEPFQTITIPTVLSGY